MTKVKKRLSKKAKEALKVLEKLKESENSKTTGGSKSGQTNAPNNLAVKINVAHKPRPNKKRG